MKIIFLAVFILLLSGCSTSQPPITEYRINSNIIKSDMSEHGCVDKSLKVAQSFSSSSLMSKDMNYAQGTHKQFVFTQSQWAESPNRVITHEIVKLLRDTKLFKSVQVSKSRSKNEWILETNIEDFLQYFDETSKKSYANIVISFTIIDAQSSNVIATKTIEHKVDTERLDASGGVEALNKALFEVLSKSREFFGGVCK